MLEFIKTIMNALKNYVDSKISKSKSDWNQNDKSADNYIKNRPFYEKNEEILLVNNLTSENYDNEDIENPRCTFVLGNTYKVIWNGVVYDNLVCHLEDDEWRVIACDDNGCPFYIDDDGGDALYVSSDNEDEVWTVSIIEYQKELKKIDKKYLPDDIGGKSDWSVNDENDSAYIKNRPFYEGNTLLITCEYESEENGYYYYLQSDNRDELEEILINNEYLFLEINGVSEKIIKTIYETEDGDMIKYSRESDGKQIFGFMPGEYSPLSYDNYGDPMPASFVARFYGLGIKTIDEKFIPDEVRVESTSYNISKEEQSQARYNIGISEHNFPELIITDKVTGYPYIISMIDKKIVYESLCDGNIYVAQMPIQTIYGVNDTINTDGMIIAAECEDGSTKEIVNYTSSTISNDGIVTITYIENGKEYTTTFTVEVIDGLEDFYYADNGDGTVTITGWKGTLNGISSTEMVFPNDSRVIL